MAGVLLLLVSIAFKVSAAPFHFWTPDVYDGAPTVFTSFMATIVKVSIFIGFVRLFDEAAQTRRSFQREMVGKTMSFLAILSPEQRAKFVELFHQRARSWGSGPQHP